jgi:PAS domain S-box-containing protein
VTERKKTILVVDDIPDDIVILEEILKKDYQVKAVTNGEAALRVARGDPPPDLILLDIMMPDMDGFEVCRNLKEDAEGAMIPVVFLTAKQMTSDEKMGFALGAVDYLRKPVDPDIVRSRIKAHLEQKDQALRSSEVRYRRLFETAKDGIMVLDAETGLIVDVNPSLARMTGYSQEFFLGRKLPDLAFMKDFLARKSNILTLPRQEYFRHKDLPLETADGRRIFVETLCNDYRVNHREVMQLNFRDITDLVAAERERDVLAAKLAHYLTTSPTITYSMAIKDGSAEWLWVSENIEGLLGYTSSEALAPEWWFRNISAEDRPATFGLFLEVTRKETANREYRFRKKDGQLVWLRDEMRILRGPGRQLEIVGTLTDISEQKQAEVEIQLKSAALEAAANAVVIADAKGLIQWANPAFEAFIGLSSSELSGKSLTEEAWPSLKKAEGYEDIRRTVPGGKVWSGTVIDDRAPDGPFVKETTITPILDAAGRVGGFVAIINDITERERSRARIETALRERGALLKEIHHRVKNNMQVLISLLAVSAHDIADAGLRGKLEDVTRRVHSMAIVHEKFYESEDLSRIDFANYLRQLLELLAGDFPDTSGGAMVDCPSGLVFLNLEQAIPAGLIVAELLTNALRYAYQDGRPVGAIRVAERLSDGGILEVEVADEGVGLPADLDPRSSQSLGMMLVRVLSEQLKGTLVFQRGKGTTAILRFPVGTETA